MNDKKRIFEEWKKTNIGELLSDSFAGGTPNRSRDDYFGGSIPWISSGEINSRVIYDTKEKITQLGLENSSAKWIPTNAVLIAMYGATAGQVAKLKIYATSNQAVLALISSEKIMDRDFLYHSLRFNKEKILYLAQGSGQPNLSKDLVERFELSYPKNVSIQKYIANILDVCDKVIEQTEAVIAKYKAIKQGMLHDLFTRGLDENGKLRPTPTEAPKLYKESELGLIPKEWEVKRLSECCKVPCSYGINAPAVDYDSKLPLYLRITDITEDGFYNKNGRKCVNALNSNQYILNDDDIVFARTGATVGKTYLYNTQDGKLIYAGFLIKCSPDPNLLNSYLLKSYTETPQYWDWVNIRSQRSGQPGINGNEYASLLLPYPTIDEQNQLANRFTVIDINIKNEVNSFDKYKKIKIGLMNQLLAT